MPGVARLRQCATLPQTTLMAAFSGTLCRHVTWRACHAHSPHAARTRACLAGCAASLPRLLHTTATRAAPLLPHLLPRSALPQDLRWAGQDGRRDQAFELLPWPARNTLCSSCHVASFRHVPDYHPDTLCCAFITTTWPHHPNTFRCAVCPQAPARPLPPPRLWAGATST